MPKRTHHAVYDLKYHLVWIPKYRKSLLLGSIEKRLKELFYEIAEEHGFGILEMEPMAPERMRGTLPYLLDFFDILLPFLYI